MNNIVDQVRKLNLPLGKYVVTGSGALAIHGIRDFHDIDILVSKDIFEAFKKEGWEVDKEFKVKWNRERLTNGEYELYSDLYYDREKAFADVEKMIAGADIIEEIPFMNLFDLRKFKTQTDRPKDIQDMRLIDEYLEKWPKNYNARN